MRRFLLAAALTPTLGIAPVWAQQPTPPAPSSPAPGNPGSASPGSANPGPTAPVPNPVIARVGDQEIHQSDLRAAAATLPPQLHSMPPQVLYPMLLNQLVDRTALVIQARKEKLQDDPAVKEQIRAAEDRVLQNALLTREVGPSLSADAVHAIYEKDYANKPGPEEVHAEHILVPTKEQAEKIITELKGGAKFSDLAKKYSKDPGAANGGDLGWFKKGDMVPAFSDAAFALKPGAITQQPVKTQFGWHVIKVLGKRQAPPPKFTQVEAAIRQQLIRDGVAKAVEKAKKGLTIVKYNPDGTAPPAGPTSGATSSGATSSGATSSGAPSSGSSGVTIPAPGPGTPATPPAQ